MIRSIIAEEFHPFGKCLMRFPKIEGKPDDLAEVHLLTGINGTGKTRILCLLASLLGNPEPLQRRLKGEEYQTILAATDQISASPENVQSTWDSSASAGQGGVSWNRQGRLYQLCNAAPAFAYSGGAYVLDTKITMMAGVSRPQRAHCLAFNRPPDQSGVLLQSIANLTLLAAAETGNRLKQKDSNQRVSKIMGRLEATISTITGIEFMFNLNPYPEPKLEVRWGGRTLSFDNLPDGLRSIIGWLAHAVVMTDAFIQGKGDPTNQVSFFLLDEIECHLHPAWQRKILPGFQRLFPKSQIFVATHSPFVISSLNKGWIHKFTFGLNEKVQIAEPLPASAGDSYISAVEDILGVREWYDLETESLLKSFREFRDQAYQGNPSAEQKAREVAATISNRSMELKLIMGREIAQMDRQFSAKK